jgi:hypothetical protein
MKSTNLEKEKKMNSKSEPKKSSTTSVELDAEMIDALTEELAEVVEEEIPSPINKAMDAVDKYMEEEAELEEKQPGPEPEPEQQSNAEMMVLHVQQLLDRARANAAEIEDGMETSAADFRKFIASRQAVLEDQRRVIILCEAALRADRFA